MSGLKLLALVFLLGISYNISNNIEASSPVTAPEFRTYIVHVLPQEGTPFYDTEQIKTWHESFLRESISGDIATRIKYSYAEVFSGFAAKLTDEEVKQMSTKDGFVAAILDTTLSLMTTRTPTFLGLQQGNGLWSSSGQGQGIIVGVIDSGLDPTHPSFSDTGLSSPPSKWKGTCAFQSCNNKIIGGRRFVGNSTAPIDVDGHGTHTASTIAGNFVANANELGQANGTASGMAPLAHLAVYKVCEGNRCTGSDVLAAIDAAVRDGVDILSLSLGGDAVPFYNDPIAIGTFGASIRGVLVSCAGGNSGPAASTVTNGAPWVLTVAATSLDRKLLATVTVGNGQQYTGEALYQPSSFSSGLLLPLFSGGDSTLAANCTSFNNVNVSGKIVLCAGGQGSDLLKGANVFRAGGAAMILYNDQIDNNTLYTDRRHVLPVSEVTNTAGLSIRTYFKSSSNPTAAITFRGTAIRTTPAPAVASFSSRGPNRPSPRILKPDISGPGLNILAAYPSSTNLGPFHVESGTSMATPHLTGVAALLKNAHPDWSISAIKSAIMTTSYTNDNTGTPIKDQNLQRASFLSMGAGHVDPTKATDPGLVFEIGPRDYISYLCGLGYSNAQVTAISRQTTNCSSFGSTGESQLNYPSITLRSADIRTVGRVTINRTVTNVGDASSSYAVQVEFPGNSGLSVTVRPETLSFAQVKEKKNFSVTLSGAGIGEGSLKLASSNNKYVVRVPIVVFLSN